MKEWYGILLSLGFILLIISLTIKIIPITNLQLFYGSLTFFLIGIGEFNNHKSYSGIKPANAYTGTTMDIRYKIREHDI